MTGLGFAKPTYAKANLFLALTFLRIKTMKLPLSKRARFFPMACLLAGASSMPAHAANILLTFEGIGNNAAVNNFYNGGAGPNLGINFSPSGFGLIDSDAGGSGNFANEPSPSTVLNFSAAGTMNVASGFTDVITFFYSSNAANASVTVYDDLNSTGNILGTLTLFQQATANNCGGDPTGLSCNWTPAGIVFNGIAKSVAFDGVANNVAFDNFVLNLSAVPEPSTLALMGLGFAAFRARRKGNSPA